MGVWWGFDGAMMGINSEVHMESQIEIHSRYGVYRKPLGVPITIQQSMGWEGG